jgi:hypothetical protein
VRAATAVQGEKDAATAIVVAAVTGIVVGAAAVTIAARAATATIGDLGATGMTVALAPKVVVIADRARSVKAETTRVLPRSSRRRS